MRIAVVNEISTSAKNAAVIEAVRDAGFTPLNVGMTGPEDTPELTYLHTSLISALLLELNLADLIIGGCGTGQGYLNAVLQYPGITCALICEPLDGWLARRINVPNCVSLALNKGYGWAGDVNLKLIMRTLLAPTDELGYPPERVESQTASRRMLKDVSTATHRPMLECLDGLDEAITRPVFQSRAFCRLVADASPSDLRDYIMARAR